MTLPSVDSSKKTRVMVGPWWYLVVAFHVNDLSSNRTGACSFIDKNQTKKTPEMAHLNIPTKWSFPPKELQQKVAIFLYMPYSVTRKKSPNIYKSCLKMISL